MKIFSKVFPIEMRLIFISSLLAAIVPTAHADLVYTNPITGKTTLFFAEAGSVYRARCASAQPQVRKDCLISNGQDKTKEKEFLFKLTDAALYFAARLSGVAKSGKSLSPLNADAVTTLMKGPLPNQWSIPNRQAELQASFSQLQGKALNQAKAEAHKIEIDIAAHANFTDELTTEFEPLVQNFLTPIVGKQWQVSGNADAPGDLENAFLQIISSRHIPRDCVAESIGDLKVGDSIVLNLIDQVSAQDPLTKWSWTQKYAGTTAKFYLGDGSTDEDGCTFGYVKIPGYEIPWRIRNLSFAH
jgi:hypothetical protein